MSCSPGTVLEVQYVAFCSPTMQPTLHAGPGLACLPLQPGGLAPASTVSRKEWALLDFCHLQQERLCSWLWGLRFHTPKGCASGSQTPSMRLPSLGSWIKQQWNGFSVSVSFLHQSDKLPPSPLYQGRFCIRRICF